MSRMALLSALVTFAVTGCAGRGLGSSEYGCKGMPEGVRCLSTREVYAATEQTDAAHPTDAEGAHGETTISPDVFEPRTSRMESEPDPRDLLPITDAPVPLRIPAQIMRIWFAPWEDASGDLYVGLVTFTEIIPRRWAIGDPYTPENTLLAPLQIEPAE